jgi:multidrug efflux system outer membrane protein
VRLLGVQVRTGLASAIVLNQAEAQLQSTLAQQQELQRARADDEHALAILCGQPASTFGVAPHPLQRGTPPVVPPGVPAAVLARRPDIAAAEQNVVSANALVGVATAELYPQFALTGAAGLESSAIQSLFDWQSSLLSIAQSMTAPLFQGGRLHANLEAARAVFEQTVALYVNQMLVAYSDVEDALSDLHSFNAQADYLDGAVRASEGYRRLAEVQYTNGLVDYLTVLDAERTLLANQLARRSDELSDDCEYSTDQGTWRRMGVRSRGW